MKDLKLADSSTNLDKRIGIFIGSDYYYSVVSGEILKGKIEEPVAINSLLGWILCGPFENNPSSVNVNFNSVHNMRVHTETMSENFIDENIHNIKKNVFADFNEIKKLENNELVNKFKDNLPFENGRCSTKLPLKEFHDVLPDNYQLAKNRFISLKNQFEKNEPLLNNYEVILKARMHCERFFFRAFHEIQFQGHFMKQNTSMKYFYFSI